jgi:hypothetical protein
MKTLMKQARMLCLLLCAACAPPLAAADTRPAIVNARQAFWWGDFDALEKQNAEFSQSGRFLPDGSSELDLFRFGLNGVIANAAKLREPYLQELEALTLRWATERPQSALAHVLHAQVLRAHGWSYRGTGLARDVPPHAWKEFEDYLKRAAAYLASHADVAMNDSYAHETLISIGTGLHWDAAQLTMLMREGLKRNPEDIDLYFTRMTALLPKWGGDIRTLDRYIRAVTEQTRSLFGTGMYARLYSSAAEQEFGHALFEDSAADWNTMKQGYADMHARYPASPKRRNGFAYMACLAKDKAALRALLDELGPALDSSEWGANAERTIEYCQRLAGEN